MALRVACFRDRCLTSWANPPSSVAEPDSNSLLATHGRSPRVVRLPHCWEGFEPAPAGFGDRRLDPIGLPQAAPSSHVTCPGQDSNLHPLPEGLSAETPASPVQWSRQDSNLQHAGSEPAASADWATGRSAILVSCTEQDSNPQPSG